MVLRELERKLLMQPVAGSGRGRDGGGWGGRSGRLSGRSLRRDQKNACESIQATLMAGEKAKALRLEHL